MDNSNLEKEVSSLQENRQQEIWQYITEIRNGNAKAFDKLYSCTEAYVYYSVVKYGVPEDSVYDVMQEVYIAIYQNLETLRDVHAALGWIKSITFHKSMDYFRHIKNEVFTGDEEELLKNSDIIDNMELPEDIIENKASRKIINDMIDALPEDYKQILVAYYFNECRVEEIAETLEIPSGTVKTKLYRARKMLQDAIKKLEKEQGIRLYSISAAPILLLLFYSEAEAIIVPTNVSEAVLGNMKVFLKQLPEHAEGIVDGGASLQLAKGAGKAASIGSKLTGTVVKKCIIGIVVVLLAGTGIAFVIKNNRGGTDTLASGASTEDTEESSDQSENTGEQLQTEEEQENSEATITPEQQAQIRQYYHAMFDTICDTCQWPDGTDLSISGDIGEALQYTVLDFDGDGYEEFAVSVITADYMAAYMERLYKYNPDTEQVSCILTLYPGAEYYDNGVVFGASDNAHRFGKDLFRYDETNKMYARQVYIFQWSRSAWEEYNGHAFPEAADEDGDGTVWCLIDSDDTYSYMDQQEYDAWQESLIGPAKKIEISWVLFSEGWQYQ